MPRLLFLLTCLGLAGRSYAQFTGPSAPGGLPGERRLVPPAPTTAGLGTYGSLPVDLNAGVVTVNVPLGEATGRSLTLPVSLSYRTTGIRVEEVASWVGLGWSLNAGGLITRTVRGLPDEAVNVGYFQAYPRWQRADSMYRANPTKATWNAKKQADQDAANGLIDTEPDTYSLTLPGQSATFLLDVQRRVHLNPYRSWTVTGDPTGGWDVVLADGVRYEFADIETTQVANAGTRDLPFASAWHLSAMVSANGKDRIELDYVPNANGFAQVVPTNRVFRAKLYVVPYAPNNNNASYCAQDPPFSDGTVVTAMDYNTLSLRRIRSATVTVDFNSDAVRPDLDPITDAPGRRLTSVVFADARAPAVTRRFDFAYAPAAARLRLDAVRQVGQPGYAFQYDAATALPPRTSYAQDHWGFYNGQSNISLLPAPPASVANGRVASTLATANRATNPAVMQAGVLTSVQYPTGGRSSFEYEANRVWETRPGVDDSVTTFTAAVSGLAPPDLNSVSQAVYDVLFPPNRVPGQPSVAATVFTLPLGATNLVVNTVPTTGTNGAYYGLYRLADGSPNPGTFQSGTQLYPPPPAGGFTVQANALTAGTYLLYAAAPDVNAFATIELRMHVTTPARGTDRAVGGLRVRRMVDDPGTGASVVSVYDYARYDSTAERRISTGRLFFEPQYLRFSPCNAAIVAAADARTLNYAQEGYHIGYDEVRVTRGGAADGTTTYRYLNGSEATGRSFVVRETATDGAGRVVKQLDNDYYAGTSDVLPLQKVFLRNYEVGICAQSECPVYYTVLDETYETERDSYRCTQEPLLSAAREQLFGALPPNGAARAAHESLRTYSYARLPTGQRFASPSWVRQFLANGEQLATHTVYAREYLAGNALDGPTAGLAALAARHVLTAVVETQQWRHHGPDSALVGGGLTHYQALEPRRAWSVAAAAPVAAPDFVGSQIQNQRFVQDPRYVETATYDRYDRWGNLTEEHYQAAFGSLLWDDRGTHVLAQVSQAHVGQVAYTSFEPAASGRWRYDTTATAPRGVTGRWCYAGGEAAVARDSLPPGTYTLTLWATAAPAVRVNGSAALALPVASVSRADRRFYCYRYRLPLTAPLSTVAISGATGELMDEVRLCPTGALMHSYTREALSGLISQTDPSGRLTTYEYDGLGRLVRTRDEQGRILSQQQYHYARRP